MSFAIYDYHKDEDIRNVLVTPQIRSRFLRMEPGSQSLIFTATTWDMKFS